MILCRRALLLTLPLLGALTLLTAAACDGPLPSSTTQIAVNQGEDPNTEVTSTTGSAASLNVLARVIDADVPDPSILVDGNNYYAFSTNANNIHIPVHTSTNLVHWTLIGESLPNLPSWATQTYGLTWSPTVAKIADNDYRMIFTTQQAAQQVQCLGVAGATQPQGPYTPIGTAPLQCYLTTQGSVDPDLVHGSDGNMYVVFKTNGSQPATAQLYMQQLAPDAKSTVGSPKSMLAPNYAWEGNTLAQPFVSRGTSNFYLTYTANAYNTNALCVGVAASTSFWGPYTKEALPAMASVGNTLVGVGGQMLFTGLDGNRYMAFHSWNSTAYAYRPMYIAPVSLLIANGNFPVDY